MTLLRCGTITVGDYIYRILWDASPQKTQKVDSYCT